MTNVERFVSAAQWRPDEYVQIETHRNTGDEVLIQGQLADMRQPATGDASWTVHLSTREARALRDCLIALELAES